MTAVGAVGCMRSDSVWVPAVAFTAWTVLSDTDLALALASVVG